MNEERDKSTAANAGRVRAPSRSRARPAPSEGSVKAWLHPSGQDKKLLQTLTEVIDFIRGREYAGLIDRLEDAVQGTAAQFVSLLARHLEDEEFVIFHSVRRAGRKKAAPIDDVEKDHETLRALARELASWIARDRAEEAAAAAVRLRETLAAHIRDEERALEAVLSAFSAAERRRLAGSLFQRRALAGVRDFRTAGGDPRISVHLVSAPRGVVVARLRRRGRGDLTALRSELTRHIQQAVPEASSIQIVS
ncbi:MAG: hemerythrin domain-containing protein [Planctomycetes bacterium]|nr:hemerythrin domain-containing protein [Planctomycetota bacterium]